MKVTFRIYIRNRVLWRMKPYGWVPGSIVVGRVGILYGLRLDIGHVF